MRADSGTMRVDGKEVHFRSTRDALAASIGMVHQELSVAPELTVAENVFFGSQPVNGMGVVAWRRMAERAAEELKNLGLDINPRARLGDFPIGVQQLVELSRVLFSGARIIILDEPTSALSPPEIERLFGVLARLREEGRSIIFISHFLDDILKISNAITIFRNGRKVETAEVTPEIDKAWIIERMIGTGREELEESYLGEIKLDSRPEAPVVLRAKDLTLAPSYRNLTFEARAGEVLGDLWFHGLRAARIGANPVRQVSPRERIARDRRQGDDAQEHDGGQEGGRRLCRREPPHDAVQRRAGLQERLDRGPRAPVEMALEAGPRAGDRQGSGQGSRRPPSRHRVAPRRPLGRQSAEGRAGQMADPPAARFSSWLSRRAAWTSAPRRTWCASCGICAIQGIAIIVFSTEPETVLSLADRVLVMRKGEIAHEFAGEAISKDRLLAAA